MTFRDGAGRRPSHGHRQHAQTFDDLKSIDQSIQEKEKKKYEMNAIPPQLRPPSLTLSKFRQSVTTVL